MSNSSTFTRAADICGLIGSLLILAAFAVSALLPNNDFPQAPIYGTGALLLLAHVAGLLLNRKGRPQWLSNLSLAVTMLGLFTVALYATLDTLSAVGIRFASTDDYWGVLVMALLLIILGRSIYAITALASGVFASWVALLHALAGVTLLLSVPVLIMGVPNISVAVRDFMNTLSLILLITFFASWGLMSVVGLRHSSAGTPASSGLSPHHHIPT
jgi:hypothetical protein